MALWGGQFLTHEAPSLLLITTSSSPYVPSAGRRGGRSRRGPSGTVCTPASAFGVEHFGFSVVGSRFWVGGLGLGYHGLWFMVYGSW